MEGQGEEDLGSPKTISEVKDDEQLVWTGKKCGQWCWLSSPEFSLKKARHGLVGGTTGEVATPVVVIPVGVGEEVAAKRREGLQLLATVHQPEVFRKRAVAHLSNKTRNKTNKPTR